MGTGRANAFGALQRPADLFDSTLQQGVSSRSIRKYSCMYFSTCWTALTVRPGIHWQTIRRFTQKAQYFGSACSMQPSIGLANIC